MHVPFRSFLFHVLTNREPCCIIRPNIKHARNVDRDVYIRLPFWPYLKLLFCMWLVLPIFNGAAYIYQNFVRKYVKIGNQVSSSYSESQKKVLLMMSLDARKSVERYIEKYGPDAFDRVIKAVIFLLSFIPINKTISLSVKETLSSWSQICQHSCRPRRKRRGRGRWDLSSFVPSFFLLHEKLKYICNPYSQFFV